jgi:hypothetical protein
MAIQGAVLAYLYPNIGRSGAPFVEAVRFWLIMGVFIASSPVLAETAKQRVTSLPAWLVAESIYYLIQFMISRVTIGLVCGRPQKGC